MHYKLTANTSPKLNIMMLIASSLIINYEPTITNTYERTHTLRHNTHIPHSHIYVRVCISVHVLVIVYITYICKHVMSSCMYVYIIEVMDACKYVLYVCMYAHAKIVRKAASSTQTSYQR